MGTEGFVGWFYAVNSVPLTSVILITVLFGPTTLVLTTDEGDLVERGADGQVTKVVLPDRLIVMANHQAYLDWMYIWILACYSGNATGIIILLKASLKKIPLIGWALVSFLIC